MNKNSSNIKDNELKIYNSAFSFFKEANLSK